MKILVTGGAGFIGSAVVRHLITHTESEVVNLDKLTYAGNLNSLKLVEASARYRFVKADICDSATLRAILDSHKPDAVMHLAAESHVDRSIDGPADFIQTNIVGTYTLLEAVRTYWTALPEDKKYAFRFHHVSTDEVFGDLGESGGLFREDTPYRPSSPYSASKASSDHLVHAWYRTFGLPIVLSNCSNNYGPYHFPEKLVPHVILNALSGKQIPVYGDGKQVRDWLYVEDHAEALYAVLTKGRTGESYNVGGHNEKTNLEVVRSICALLDELAPEYRSTELQSYADLIVFVKDRPGHDRRYAIDATKIQNELGWLPKETFQTGLRKTVKWYLENRDWWESVLSGDYRLERLGFA